MAKDPVSPKIVNCGICGCLLYEEDSIKIKGKKYCPFCATDFFKQIYELKKKNGFSVFCIFGLPFFLALAWFIAMAIASIPGVSTYANNSVLACIFLPIISAIVSAILFGKKHDLMTTIGDPESLLVSTSGSIDDYGNVSLTTRGYDVYSAGQVIDMIFNVVKFLGIMIMLLVGGWVYCIIFWVGLGKARRGF